MNNTPIGLHLAGTGHRPPRLGLDYGPNGNRTLTKFVASALTELISTSHNIKSIVQGMAQGFDQALAHAAITLNIPVIAALPFEGQESKWPSDSKRRFNAILAKCKEVKVVSKGGYHPEKYLVRDEWMVDRVVQDAAAGDGELPLLIALFDGQSSGGTNHTFRYAFDESVVTWNLWNAWAKRQAAGVSGLQKDESDENIFDGIPNLRG